MQVVGLIYSKRFFSRTFLNLFECGEVTVYIISKVDLFHSNQKTGIGDFFPTYLKSRLHGETIFTAKGA